MANFQPFLDSLNKTVAHLDRIVAYFNELAEGYYIGLELQTWENEGGAL